MQTVNLRSTFLLEAAMQRFHVQRQALRTSPAQLACTRQPASAWRLGQRTGRLQIRSAAEGEADTAVEAAGPATSAPERSPSTGSAPSSSRSAASLDKEVSRFATKAASTFAPRASGKVNPAYKGSVLYTVFEVQAWLSVAVGALLSYNVIFPSDEPNIARLLGMWSIWMFTVPSLRARECTPAEKDALNLLFLAIPLLNVALPFVWKSFPFIFTADCVMMAGVYAWKFGGGAGGAKGNGAQP